MVFLITPNFGQILNSNSLFLILSTDNITHNAAYSDITPTYRGVVTTWLLHAGVTINNIYPICALYSGLTPIYSNLLRKTKSMFAR